MGVKTVIQMQKRGITEGGGDIEGLLLGLELALDLGMEASSSSTAGGAFGAP